MSLPLPWASPEVVDQVLAFGRSEDPHEAGGVITPDLTVILLPNRSESPTNSYVISDEDLVNEIDQWLDRNPNINPEDLTRAHFIIWHTHPNGGVGPSRRDMKCKAEGFQYMVVAMPDGPASLF